MTSREEGAFRASGQGVRKRGFGVCFAGRAGLCKTHVQYEDVQGMLALGSKASECTQESSEGGKTSLKKRLVLSVTPCNKS